MNEEVGRVECHKLRGEWWLMLVTGLVGAAFFAFGAITPDNQNEPVTRFMCASISLFFLFSVFGAALTTFRAYIIADASGLRWREVGKERFARWDEVTDFYMDESSTRKATIETIQGNIDAAKFDNQEAFRAWVQSHATNAASREWTTRHVSKKTRWPRTFAYKRVENLIMPSLPFLFVLSSLASYLFDKPRPNYSPGFSVTMREMLAGGGPLSAFIFLVIMTLAAAFFLFALSWFPILFWTDTRPRWKQRIIATPNDITFVDGEKTIRAAWNDVTRVTRQKDKFMIRRYLVETRQGDFDFSDNIYWSSRLLQLFREYSNDAVKVLTQQEAAASAGDLGKAFVRNGQRIHHFRARHNRVMLWAVWSLAFIPIAPMLIYIPSDAPQAHRTVPIVLSVLGVLIACWLSLFSKTNYVATDENGLTQRTSFRTKFIAWNDVERFGKNDWSCFVVIGARERICFWSEIAEQEQLLETIAQSSTRSQTREWHHL